MKIDIIVVYVQRYTKGHEIDFVPPITGIYLAAITPPQYEVRVIHQQVQPIDYDTDADVIALSLFQRICRGSLSPGRLLPPKRQNRGGRRPSRDLLAG